MGKVVAGALFFFFRDMAEYYMTALLHSHRAYQPLGLIIFEAMKSFSERGIRFFNFGGTWPSQEGLRRFKEGWGGVPYNYTYFIKGGVDFSSLQKMTPAQITKAYPYFYVIPFNRLGHRDPKRLASILP